MKWFGVTRKVYDSNHDRYGLLHIWILDFHLKIFGGSTARYAGWIDSDDHSKGIREWTRGFNIEFDFSHEKEIIRYPKNS